MITRPQTLRFPAGRAFRAARGFSLLEALIAVVVLSTGLLALAALQSAMIRSSVDARIRSSASAAAASVVENWRSVGYENVPAVAGSLSPLPDYIVADPAAGAFTITYNNSLRVPDASGNFTLTAANPALPPPRAEFKLIDITVAWNDPYNPGNQRQVRFTDIIGPLGASLQSPDLSQLGGSLAPQRPIVRSDDPSGPGVIPIAVGNGEDTAATNPKPVIVSQGNNDTVIETRFDVLNFSDAGSDFEDDVVQIQRRVETSIVGCRCTLGASAGGAGTISGTAFRPTFWDGTRYAAPERASAGGGAPSNNSGVQSDLCTDCCRDHHDPAGETGPKFDPFRAQDGIAHSHFLTVDALNPLSSSPVSSGGDYFEACRLIRVDGLWRVASDLDSRFFGLLKTSQDIFPADNPVPDDDAADDYVDFVLDALNDEFLVASPSVSRSTDLAPRYAAAGLVEPAIAINRPSGGGFDFRFLHARGFYVDHLEQQARDRITEARTNCPSGTPVATCVLPFLPFTTINTTELAKWAPSSPAAVQVTNASGVLFGDPENPVRGQVNALPIGPNTGDAVAVSGRSNSGLVATNLVTDPQDLLDAQSDGQPFSLSSGGVDPQGERFNVNLVGLPQTADANTSNDPRVTWRLGTTFNNCTGTFTGNNDNNPNPYNCITTSSLNLAIEVVVGQYNRVVEERRSVSCTVGGTTVTSTLNNVPVCENYQLASASVGGTAGTIAPATNDGRLNETTVVAFGLLSPNSTATLGFSLQNATPATVRSCTFNNGGNQIASIVYNAACP